MDSEAKQGKINDKQRKRFDFSMVISSFNLLLFVAMFVRCEIVFREFFSQENRLSSLQQEMDRLSGLVPALSLQEQATGARQRRQINTKSSVTIDDVRQEVRRLIIAYKGPQGPPGERGRRGKRGLRGRRGPPVFENVPNSRIAVAKSNDVVMNCKAVGNPIPVVTWSRAFQSLPDQALVYKNGTLVLKGYKSYDSGTYLCKAANTFGKIQHVTHLYTKITSSVFWQEKMYFWCTHAYRTYIQSHLTKEQCKDKCLALGDCKAVEWWGSGDTQCYICKDPSQRESYNNRNDASYPPYVLIRPSK